MKNCTILLHFIVISLEADTITNMEGVEYVCLPDHCAGQRGSLHRSFGYKPSWPASVRTVFKDSFGLQMLKRCLILSPNKSSTRTL
jgi:hypothetical protein